MAPQQDVEYNEMSLNAPGSSASQSAGRDTQIAESHGRLEKRVEVIVVRAINIPSTKKHHWGRNRKVFVTVSNSETTAKTADVPVEEQKAKWNQILDPFLVQPSSQLTLHLYAEGSAHPILIGAMPIPLASQSDIPCVLKNTVGEAVWSSGSTQPVILYVTIHITPEPDKAVKPIDPIDPLNAWEGAVGRIKWAMGTLNPNEELYHLAKMAHHLLSTIPKTLLEQYQRDDNLNVQALFRAMYDAFDFTHHEDTLKSIKPQSEQARILTLMLQDVCSCCDFIQLYAEDAFWKRTLMNIDGGTGRIIKELSDVLVHRRKDFLDQATISTQITSTAFQILNDVAKPTQPQHQSPYTGVGIRGASRVW